MKIQKVINILFVVVSPFLWAQHDITIQASLQPENHTIEIHQEIVYHNTSEVPLNEIYLNDWANSFSSKTTPLGKRFAENYNSSFHFEKEEERGRTTIQSIEKDLNSSLEWSYEESQDIIKVILDEPLAPGNSYAFNLSYIVKLPSDKFTRYGFTDNGEYKLRYWYISPAVFDGKWHVYSNKNVDDLYLTPSRFNITFTFPKNYQLVSDFTVISENNSEGNKTTILEGENRMSAKIYLLKRSLFETISTDKLDIVTNLKDKKVTKAISALSIDRIVHFLDEKLGPYPHDKMLITKTDYKKNPVYGLNQLPDFISPFPDGFEYNMEQIKAISRIYLENSLALDPRKDHWLIGALQVYLMMEYVDQYYPKMKLIGNLSNLWVIKWSHISDIEFNDQYPLLYLNMARQNLQQSLTTPKDSLIKFNKNIASDYFGGNGLQYLSDYIGEEAIDKAIKDFYTDNRLKPVEAIIFQDYLEENTDLPVNWFFDNYLDSRSTIDFKIKKVEKRGDSLDVTIRNKRNHPLPVSLYGLNSNNIVFKKWTTPIDSSITITVQGRNIEKLALNYETIIPEFNQRNNFKSVDGLLNRPIQFRLFQDIEDPKYNQLFFMPVFQYNLYDGFTIGPKLYNKTLLRKNWNYKVEPQYGFNSKTIVGKGSVSYRHSFEEGNLYRLRAGIAGSLFSYNTDLFYKRLSPFVNLAFRNNDIRDNEKQFINIRNVNVFQDVDINDPNQEPNYSVLNLQYAYSNPNLINYFRGVVDTQFSSKFSKISTTLEYRKLFLNNRQLNVRLFAGAFLHNDTAKNGNFFSFALDRPTDYLFDYTYYGRSEDTGLFSQQLVVAEGGFKSKLTPAFSNSWMATINASTNVWNWVYAYGDAGFVNNRGQGTEAVFDSGIRLSLVADYFELFFPLYSNLGWEPSLGNYDQRIRFIVTLDPKTLLGLFTREWY